MLRALVLAGAAVWLAVALAMVAVDAGAWPMLIIAALAFAGIVFERSRYRGGVVPLGAAARWRETGERFLDETTGEPVTVWFDPASGARRYVGAGEAPPGP